MKAKIGKKTYDTQNNSVFVYTLTENESVRRDLFKTFKGDLFIYEYFRNQDQQVSESIKVFNRAEDLCKELLRYQALSGVANQLSHHFNVKGKRTILNFFSKNFKGQP